MSVGGSTPVLARFHSPVEAVRAEQRWLEGLYMDTPEEWDDPYRFFRWSGGGAKRRQVHAVVRRPLISPLIPRDLLQHHADPCVTLSGRPVQELVHVWEAPIEDIPQCRTNLGG
jgi:hypothetical protein